MEDDVQLMQKFKNGDKESFERLVIKLEQPEKLYILFATHVTFIFKRKS